MTVSIVVPYRYGGHCADHRAEVFDWCQRWWAEHFADCEMVVADSTLDEFSHSEAFNIGAERATSDVLILVDADTIVKRPFAVEATGIADDGVPVFARWYRMLDERSTERVLTSPNADPDDGEYLWEGDASSWAGFCAIRRDQYLDVGGYEERVTGWGPDDACWGMTLTALAPPIRLEGSVYHLWHPVRLRDTYGPDDYPPKRDLAIRYQAASRDPADMRALIAERDGWVPAPLEPSQKVEQA